MSGKRSKSTPFPLATLAALAIFLSAIFPTARAQAGVEACLETASETLELAQLTAEKGPKMVDCANKLIASGPVGIGIGGLLGLLYAAGEFNTENQCNQLINTKIAEGLTALLEEVPALRNALSELFGKGTIDGFIELVSNGATDALASNPALEPIFGFITCGCTVVGGAAEIKDQLVLTGKYAAACAAVVGEAVGEVQDFIFGEHKGNWGPSVTVDPDNICKIGVMDASITEVWELEYAKLFKGQTYYPSLNKTASCTCPEGSNVVENVYTVTCQCEGPRHLEYGTDGKAFCAMDCPAGTKKHVGAVHLCVSICAAGTTYDPFSTNCKSNCAEGQIFDPNTNQCTSCPADTRAYVNGTNGAGQCIACAKGTGASAGSDSCDSICPAWQDWENGFCISPCAPGMKVGYTGAELNTKVICQTCPANTTYNPGTNSCETCPVGATWENSMIGGVCSCPEGMGASGGVCQTCGKGSVLTASWTGLAATCTPCPDCDKQTTERPRIVCAGNAIPDPNNPYTACKACPKETRALNGRYCMSTRVTARTVPPKELVVSAENTNKELLADPRNCPAAMKFPDGSCAAGKPGVIRASATRETCRSVAGSSYIPSQLNKQECSPCPQGTQPNIQGTVCVQTASLDQKGGPRQEGRDKFEKQLPKSNSAAANAKSDKGGQKRSIAPDLDLPGFGGSGSTAPSGSGGYGGPGGFRGNTQGVK